MMFSIVLILMLTINDHQSISWIFNQSTSTDHYPDFCGLLKDSECGRSAPEVFTTYSKCRQKLAIKSSLPSNRIYNGTDSIDWMWKWFHKVDLSLYDQKEGQSFCSGTILYGNWVMTAAHCLEYNMIPIQPKDYHKVIIETKDPPIRRYPIDRVVFHPARKPANLRPGAPFHWKNDIALIKINGSINTLWFEALCPPRSRFQKIKETKLIMIGMGNVAGPGQAVRPADRLQEIVIESEDCLLDCYDCYCMKSPSAWVMDSGSAVMSYCEYEGSPPIYYLHAIHQGYTKGQCVFLYAYGFRNWIIETIQT